MASLSVLHLAHCEVDDIMIIYIFEARGHMESGATSSSAKVKDESAMTKGHQKCSKVWKQGRSAIAAKKGTNRINKASPIGFQRNRCSLSEKAVFYCWLCQPNPTFTFLTLSLSHILTLYVELSCLQEFCDN